MVVSYKGSTSLESSAPKLQERTRRGQSISGHPPAGRQAILQQTLKRKRGADESPSESPPIQLLIIDEEHAFLVTYTDYWTYHCLQW